MHTKFLTHMLDNTKYCVCVCVFVVLLLSMQADSQMSKDRQIFYDASLQYVFKIQEVQERKKFEFVEPVSSHTNINTMFICNFSTIQLCALVLG